MSVDFLTNPFVFQRPTAGEAGQYRCNIKNELGETNANLSLNFQQDEQQQRSRSPSQSRTPKEGSRPGTPSRRRRDRSETPSRRHKSKSREGSPKKSVRSRPGTPTPDENSLQPDAAAGPTGNSSRRSSKGDAMEVDNAGEQVFAGSSVGVSCF